MTVINTHSPQGGLCDTSGKFPNAYRLSLGPVEDAKFGWAATIITVLFPEWVEGIFPNGFGAQQIFGMVDALVDDVFGEYGGQTASDLNPASAVAEEISDFQSAMPGLAFYGVEDSPVHWRAMSSKLKPSSDQQLDGEYDEDLLEWVHRVADIYKGIDDLNHAIGVFHDINPFPPNGSRYHYLATLWRQGHQWINDDSEPGWVNLLGAGNQIWTIESVKELAPDEAIIVSNLQALLFKLSKGSPAYFETLAQIEQIINDPSAYICVNKDGWKPSTPQPNDGIVTQSDCHRADLPEDRNKMIEHANHFELRNHENARTAYTDAFLDENSFFELKLQ
ncbi:MAG: hypothetical protein K9I85_10050 [Saprospiraceae bacterium]|nr:hypothetical protein [Saprospiraceae bacterium]